MSDEMGVGDEEDGAGGGGRPHPKDYSGSRIHQAGTEERDVQMGWSGYQRPSPDMRDHMFR